MNSSFGFDFLTFDIIGYQADNEDSDDADGVVQSPARKRKLILRRVAKIATEPIRAKMMKNCSN